MRKEDDFDHLSDIELKAWEQANAIINKIDDHPGINATPICHYENAKDFKSIHKDGTDKDWRVWRAVKERVMDIVEDARSVNMVDVVIKPDELRDWLRENGFENTPETRNAYVETVFAHEELSDAAYEELVETNAKEQAEIMIGLLDAIPLAATAPVPSYTPEAYTDLFGSNAGLPWETWWDAHCMMIDLVEHELKISIVEIFVDPNEYADWLKLVQRHDDDESRLLHVLARFNEMSYDEISAHQTLAIGMDHKMFHPDLIRVPLPSYRNPEDFKAVVKQGEYQCWGAWRASMDHILWSLRTMSDLEPEEVFINPNAYHQWARDNDLPNEESTREKFAAWVFSQRND